MDIFTLFYLFSPRNHSVLSSSFKSKFTVVEIVDIQLLDDLRKNSAKARSRLYHLYAKKLLGICMRYTKNRYEAEDVLHDAFLKIYTKIDQFTGDGSFEGWLKRITTNTAIQFLRDRSKELKTMDIEEYEGDVSEDLEIGLPDLSPSQLMELIQKLPNGYRLVFNMYVFEQMSHNDISEQLNISVGTSKSQLSRAKLFLRNEILILVKKMDVKEPINQFAL